MDNPGWHARHRAKKVSPYPTQGYVSLFLDERALTVPIKTPSGFFATQDEARWSQPQRGPDGRYTPVEPNLQPMQESFVGGFAYPGAHSGPSSPPPPIPPKDDYIRRLQASNGHHGSALSQTSSISSYATGDSAATSGSSLTYVTQQMAKLSAVERSSQYRVARMNPHLQFMAGPLLRYDTVDEEGIWHGAALVVSKCIQSSSASPNSDHNTIVPSLKPRTLGQYTSHTLR